MRKLKRFCARSCIDSASLACRLGETLDVSGESEWRITSALTNSSTPSVALEQ